MADGAHVSDPGCNCDTPVNPNSDMISGIQGADVEFQRREPEGPGCDQLGGQIGRQGFPRFRLLLCPKLRDERERRALQRERHSRSRQNKYYYPGVTVGGPVLIPGTKFNKNRDKLFFFTGLRVFLPGARYRACCARQCRHAGELGGNFSPAEVAKEGNITASGGASRPNQCAERLAKFPGGIIPHIADRPEHAGADEAVSRSRTPIPTQRRVQLRAGGDFQSEQHPVDDRVDYNISDNTKLFVRYNLQRETQQFPVGLWWRQTDQVPYPTPVQGKNRSDSMTASLTHVFSPTMTNEFVFAYTYVGFPNVFQDPSQSEPDQRSVITIRAFSRTASRRFRHSADSGWTHRKRRWSSIRAGSKRAAPSAGLYADK